MGEIILFPTSKNYCKECVYHNEKWELAIMINTTRILMRLIAY